jgi:hypothetical protein
MRVEGAWGSLRGAVFVAALVGVAPSAWASNVATPRTPPVFKREACTTIVDRSVDPIFQLDFAIPYEDAVLTADELPDSRRFQFFAVCRDHPFGESLPNWAFMDDAERALEAEIITALPEPADVLELAPAWSAGHDGAPGTCVAVMNDERIPITCEATDGALEWDTSDVPPGNYVVHSQTFEPDLNLWASRRGVVQIVDDADQRFPVVSIMFPARDGTRAYEHDGYRVVGCMDGPSGTTVTLSWATAGDLAPEHHDESVWMSFAVLDAADGTFDLVFEPPPEAVQQAVIFRGVAEDPGGNTWVGHAPHPLIVYPGEGESDPPFKPAGPDYCGFYPDEEGDTTGGPEPDPTGTDEDGAHTTGLDGSTGTASGGATDGGSSGCQCRSGRMPSGATWLGFWLFALTAVKRRRRSTARGRGARPGIGGRSRSFVPKLAPFGRARTRG